MKMYDRIITALKFASIAFVVFMANPVHTKCWSWSHMAFMTFMFAAYGFIQGPYIEHNAQEIHAKHDIVAHETKKHALSNETQSQ